MGNITGASLAPIYERINGTANYHPYDAETFSDWSLEAGDLVKVVRGDENYKSPIHSSSLVWTGSPNMTLTSTGNQAREAVAKVSKKKYARSGYGRRNNKKNNGMWHTIEETDEYYRTIYADEFNGLRSTIEQTASYWRSTLEDTKNSLRSQIEQTASYWRSTLEDTKRGLRSQIEQTASYWRSSISSVADGDGNVTAASIAVAINEAGESEAHIDAEKVYIGNEKSTTVISGKCELEDVSASYISGEIAKLAVLNLNSLYASNQISTAGYVYAGDFVIGSATGGSGNRYVHNAVTELQIIGPTNNTYTLQKKDFNDSDWVNVGSFERNPPTTVSMAWNGSSGESAGVSNNITGTAAVGGAKTEYVKLSAISGTVYLKAGSSASTVESGGGTVVAKITDEYLVAGNIKKDVAIFGITGTYAPTTTVSMAWNGSTGESAGESNNITGTAACGGSNTEYMKLNAVTGTIYLKAGSSSSTVESGGGTVVAKITDANLTAGNIKKDVSIFGVKGTYAPSTTVSMSWNGSTGSSAGDSNNITGTAACGGSKTEYMKLSSSSGTIYLKAGSSSSTVSGGGGTVVAKITSSNLKASNIKSGVSIFGVTGTYGSFSWGEKSETTSDPGTVSHTYGTSYVSSGSSLWIKISISANGSTYTCKFKCVGA